MIINGLTVTVATVAAAIRWQYWKCVVIKFRKVNTTEKSVNGNEHQYNNSKHRKFIAAAAAAAAAVAVPTDIAAHMAHRQNERKTSN